MKTLTRHKADASFEFIKLVPRPGFEPGSPAPFQLVGVTGSRGPHT